MRRMINRSYWHCWGFGVVGLNIYALLFWDGFSKPQGHSLLPIIFPFDSLFESVVRNRGLIPEILYNAVLHSVFVGIEIYWFLLGIVAGFVFALPLSLIRIRNQPLIRICKVGDYPQE